MSVVCAQCTCKCTLTLRPTWSLIACTQELPGCFPCITLAGMDLRMDLKSCMEAPGEATLLVWDNKVFILRGKSFYFSLLFQQDQPGVFLEHWSVLFSCYIS